MVEIYRLETIENVINADYEPVFSHGNDFFLYHDEITRKSAKHYIIPILFLMVISAVILVM